MGLLPRRKGLIHGHGIGHIEGHQLPSEPASRTRRRVSSAAALFEA